MCVFGTISQNVNVQMFSAQRQKCKGAWLQKELSAIPENFQRSFAAPYYNISTVLQNLDE